MAEKDLLERIRELVVQHGKKWKEIAQTIEAEGYRDEDGNPFSDNAVRKRWWRQQKERPARAARIVKRTPIKESEHPTPVSDVSEATVPRVELDELKRLLQEQTASIKVELREFVKEQVKNLTPAPSQTPLPQQPGYRKAAPIGERDDTGRGYTDEWRRVKLAATVHHKLESMFQAERRAREFSVSRMLDTVLWHYFGCPPLGEEGQESGGD